MEQQQRNLFSGKDFERYYNGKMTAAEMHALEKAALDDPFLGDALEGYAHTKTPVKDSEQLKAAMQKKMGERKSVSGIFKKHTVLKAAAMILIVAGLGWAVYRLALPAGKTLATYQETKLQTSIADSTKVDSFDSFLTGDTFINKSNAAPHYSPQKKGKSIPGKELAGKIKGLVNENESPPVSLKDNVAEDRAVTLQSKSIPALTAAPITQTRFFKGRVVDRENNPLPFASVQSEKDNITTQTDINGNFSIAVQDTILNGTVSLIGYEGATLHLNKADTGATVMLQETAVPLSEVVNAERSRKSYRPDIAAQSGTLEPAEGWSSFDDYIARNLKVPEEAQKKGLSGNVILSFEINITGEPVNIKVEKSLCATCDKEAIRLLQNGPAWRKKGGKKGVAHFRF